MAAKVAPPPRVVIVTPAERGSRSGNRTTALRWSGLLRQLGVPVRIAEHWRDEPCDVLIAVHARKSADSVLAWARDRPGSPVAVLLAGTDVYPEFAPDAETLQVIERAVDYQAPQLITVKSLGYRLARAPAADQA